MTLPFYNGKDLEDKFNHFFNPAEFNLKKSKKETEVKLPEFASHLNLKQNNWIFALRNHISLELDLRSLSLLSTSENVLISSGNLLELQFVLTTPWGARIVNPVSVSDTSDEPQFVKVESNGKQVVWTLQPGEINQLEAIFWVPSPIGIGTLVIVMVTALGMYLKSNIQPSVKIDQPSIPTKV